MLAIHFFNNSSWTWTPQEHLYTPLDTPWGACGNPHGRGLVFPCCMGLHIYFCEDTLWDSRKDFWDEIYHLLCTPVPRSVILKVHTVHRELQMTNGILTLIDAFFPKGLHLHLYWQCIPNLHFKGIAPNFQAEHFLFHSQLLKKSNFVSFPPLTSQKPPGIPSNPPES